MMLHNSHLPFFRSPAGPVAAGSTVVIRFLSDEAVSVVLRTWIHDERAYPMLRDGDTWSYELTLPDETGLLWYDFIAYLPDGKIIKYGAPTDGLGGEGEIHRDGLHSFQITIYNESFHTPSFMHGATIYQIFPDRFRKAPTKAVDKRDNRKYQQWDEDLMIKPDPKCMDNCVNNFYGGTLTGITEKLDYLHDLGVEILYLNPIFEAYSNHRYDTGDYTKIDPLLGTMEEFEELCHKADELGMHVMLDGVFSHTGEDSIYFNDYGHYPEKGASQGTDSKYYDWYTFEHFPDKYRCWWGFKNLPEVRKDNPEYQHFMFNDQDGIVPTWIRRGACGWRLDVADELPMDFLRKLRQAAKKAKRDAVVLGEVWEDASNKVAYGEMRCYCQGDTLDSVMNYPLREAAIDFFTGKINAAALKRLIQSQQENYPIPFYYALMNLAGSHDRARILNMLAGKTFEDLPPKDRRGRKLSQAEYGKAAEKYVEMTRLLCALPGIPCIYYGDEAGLQGSSDPFCRGTFPWGRENRELQQKIREILWQRRRSPALQTGTLTLEAVDDDTLRICRAITGGKDVFGDPAPDETITVEIRR